MIPEDPGSQGDAPQPPDESWWSAVLNEESRTVAPAPLGSAVDWTWVAALYADDVPVSLPIVGFNRGGLLVRARSLRGFIPASHLIESDLIQADIARSEILASMVGDTMHVKVIELDRSRGRLIFSERAALTGPGERNRLLKGLRAGDQTRGQVTNITPFGVFVELGGLEGLIHVSELSWGRVRHPEDVVQCGQELEVKVLSIDSRVGRVGLSLKDLLPDPWASLDDRYKIGDLVTGVVTNVVHFGAFVRVEEGLEGLVHTSELGGGDSSDPRHAVGEGDRVQVRIIHIDAGRRRLGLSLKQAPRAESMNGRPPEEYLPDS